MPDRRVLVYRLGDGRWTWRVIEDEMRIENGPAYPKRAEAGLAALNLFPETLIEIEA